MAPQSVILITGCSSGIGAALAEEFHERGHRVYATARRPESLRPWPPAASAPWHWTSPMPTASPPRPRPWRKRRAGWTCW